jgi:hypothetical protein
MKKLLIIILLISVSLFIFIQGKYDASTNIFNSKKRHLSIPSSTTLKILSFGNVNLMSDIMYIWAIQFFSTKSILNRYDYAVEVFNKITDLNPKFEDPYNMGFSIIAYMAKKPQKAIDLLQKARKNIKGNHYFDYFSAYLAWYHLKDYKLAKKYYKQMNECEDLPDILKNFWINMDIKLAGTIADQKKAFEMWEKIKKIAKSPSQLNAARANLLQIKYKIDKAEIKEYIGQFLKRYKRLPLSLKELKNKLKIKTRFLDYLGHEYKYDKKTGEIVLVMEDSWKRFL